MSRYADVDKALMSWALDELLNRFPEWTIDYDDMELALTSTVRGWEHLRMVV